MKLQTKILLLAFVNFFILISAALVFVRVQFRVDLGSFLLAPARDRILSASRLIALQLPNTPHEQWDTLMRSGSIPADEVYLFDDEGNQLAGKTIELPEEVKPPGRRPGPRPDQDPHGPPPFRGNRPRPGGPPLAFTTTSNPTRYWITSFVSFPMQPGEPPMHEFLIWQFNSLWTNSFFFNYKPWLAVAALVMFISALCWLPFIRGLTRSIAKLTTATGQIAEGRFEVKLPEKRHDELDQLADSIHQMAQRLAGYVAGQKRFLGDIAHELCSPIARLQLGLGILEQHASPEELPYVTRVYEEIQHMSALVNELLLFSKTSLGATANLETVGVLDIVRRTVEREAVEYSRIETRIDERLEVVAQKDYLFRALSNIVRNAIRYAGDAGPIVISAERTGGKVLIKVADSGPGVPGAELEEIMKPFYRPESARQRETGGVGLGLAIVRTCVEACGGQVTCRNTAPKGFEVELSLAAA